jgi:uncharacterized OB-fold protein
MPLLEIDEIMIDEDEAREGMIRIDEDGAACPKCGKVGLIVGANYCFECGQKVTWYSQIVP